MSETVPTESSMDEALGEPDARPGPQPIVLPPLSLTHLRRLTDDTGLLQHARFSVPRRSEGYTSDDNARALMLTAWLSPPGGTAAAEVVDLATTYLSYCEHAQTRHGWFRNFMDFDRRWAARPVSEDCQGRCLWAMAEVVASGLPEGLRRLAAELLDRGMVSAESARSQRPVAYHLLAGLRALATDPSPERRSVVETLAERLSGLFHSYADDAWPWFEHGLYYANARMPQAMFAAAEALGRADLLQVATRSMAFLARETIRDGVFEPVGSSGWYPRGQTRAGFDQQPIEAMAMVDAAIAAHRATGEPHYARLAGVAARWFTGANVHGLSLVDVARGSCRDGLNAEGLNLNEGAESTLAWLLARQAMARAGLTGTAGV